MHKIKNKIIVIGFEYAKHITYEYLIPITTNIVIYKYWYSYTGAENNKL